MGFKHSLVTVVAAATAAVAPVRISNCPDIAETHALAQAVTELGGSATYNGEALVVDCACLDCFEVKSPAAAGIHGVVYLLPALLGRLGKARVPTVGGCQVGDSPGGRRPIKQYVDILQRFGARATVLSDGSLEVVGTELRGCEIDLLDFTGDRVLWTGPLYSGATKMALLTAVAARDVTVLHHPYPKPDVTDLVDMLGRLGADIETTDTGSIVVHGQSPGRLDRAAEHVLIPDLIEVMTWICAGAVLGGEPLTIRGPGMDRAVRALAPELEVLDEMGVRLEPAATELTVHPAQRLLPVDITVHSHGVFSDSQPFLALLAAMATGDSSITETVWANRFGYVPGLAAFNMDVRRQRQTLFIRGPWEPRPAAAPIHGTDLRAAAVLLLAALAVPGVSTVTGTHHLARGYRDLAGALSACGADITRVK